MSRPATAVPVIVVGGGDNSAVGRAHLAALQMDARWQIIAAVTSSTDSSSNWPDWMPPEAKRFSTMGEMFSFAQSKADLAIVLSPSTQHLDHVTECLRAGLNVIVEKPVALSLRDVSALRVLAESAGLKIYGVQNYTGFPMVQVMRRLAAEAIGRVLHVRAEMLQEGYVRKRGGVVPRPQAWRLVDPQIPMVVHDLGTHLFHLVDHVARVTPESVVGFFGQPFTSFPVEASLNVLGRGAGGAAF